MASTEFDLLNGENNLFYVTFDILTPRPHFLILPRKEANINRDFGEMKIQEIQELIKVARIVMERYKIPSGTLSFHRGSWFSPKAKTFHAHICVDVTLYSELFRQKKDQVKSRFWSPKITRENYLDLVLEYHTKSDFEKEVATTERLPVILPNVEWPSVDQEGIREVLHPSHPKIGFVGKRDEITQERLVKLMDDFANKLGLTDLNATFEHDGCHVCLPLSPGKLILHSSVYHSMNQHVTI